MSPILRLRAIRVAATLVALGLALAACGSNNALDDDNSGSSNSGTITIGSANFPENTLLAEMYAGALKANGIKVSTKLNIGGREVYIPALQDGSIDLVPEYTGVLLDYFTKNKIPAGVSNSDQIYTALKKSLPSGVEILKKSPAEDKDVLAVTKSTADKFQLTSISDLSAYAKNMTIGAAPEWAARQQGIVGLEKVYGLKFKRFKHLDAGGPLTIAALKNGNIQVGNIFSTDSSLATGNLVALTDPKSLFGAQNIVPLIRASSNNSTVTDTLNAVSAALTTQNLTEALARVQVDKIKPETVASDFLTKHGLS